MKLEKFVHHGNYNCSMIYKDGHIRSCNFKKVFKDRYRFSTQDVDRCEVDEYGCGLICPSHFILLNLGSFQECEPIEVVENEKVEEIPVSPFILLYRIMRRILKI